MNSHLNATQLPYDSEFYSIHVDESLRSARKVLKYLHQHYFQPNSVIDVGCGTGAWLLATQENGATELKGIDGAYVQQSSLLIGPELFEPRDLNTSIVEKRKYDLAICLEVAEHLLPERGPSFVSDLCNLSGTVLFSAALPFQGGTSHTHEQWLEFWALEFARNGLLPYDLLRDQIWNDFTIASWYRQNIIVFAKPDIASTWKTPAQPSPPDRLSRVHPEITVINAGRLRRDSHNAREPERIWYQRIVEAARQYSNHGGIERAGESTTPNPLTIAEDITEQEQLIASRVYSEDAGGIVKELEQNSSLTKEFQEELNRREWQVGVLAKQLAQLEYRSQELSHRGQDSARIEASDIEREAYLPQCTLPHNQRLLAPNQYSIPFNQFLRQIVSLLVAHPFSREWRRYWKCRSLLATINRSILFDAGYYLASNADVQASGTDPLQHFILHGAAEGRNPHPLFDINYYLKNNSDVAKSRVNPLAHFLEFGAAEKRSPHPLFNTAYYLSNNPDVRASDQNPLEHYLRFGANEGRDPHPLFCTAFYLDQYHDVRAAGTNPLVHYLKFGGKEGRSPHWLIRRQWVPSISSHRQQDSAGQSSLFIQALLEGRIKNRTDLMKEFLHLGARNGCFIGSHQLKKQNSTVAEISHDSMIADQLKRASLLESSNFKSYTTRLKQGIILNTITCRLPATGMAQRLFTDPIPAIFSTTFADEVTEHFTWQSAPPIATTASSAAPSFTIATRLFQQIEFFADCARSVAALSQSSKHPIEWIVINDDPAVTEELIRKVIPKDLIGCTQIVSDGQHCGPINRARQAAALAKHEWLLFLDGDDYIASEAANVLADYIADQPLCRYLSSCAIDIDAQGAILRHRQRQNSPAHLFTDGMTATPLRCIRRDLFIEIDPLTTTSWDSSLLYDYDFALKVANQEPILYLPEYLYYYRWHGASQSINQHLSTPAHHLIEQLSPVRRQFVEYFSNRLPASLRKPSPKRIDPLRSNMLAICANSFQVISEKFEAHPNCPNSNPWQSYIAAVLIPVHNGELDSFKNTLESVIDQQPVCLPVVIVAESGFFAERIARLVNSRCSSAVVLASTEEHSTRGTLQNLALSYLQTSQQFKKLAFVQLVAIINDGEILNEDFSPYMKRLWAGRSAEDRAVIVCTANRYDLKSDTHSALGSTLNTLGESEVRAADDILAPLNCFCIGLSALQASGVIFEPRLTHHQDYFMLTQLHLLNFEFVPCKQTVAQVTIKRINSEMLKAIALSKRQAEILTSLNILSMERCSNTPQQTNDADQRTIAELR